MPKGDYDLDEFESSGGVNKEAQEAERKAEEATKTQEAEAAKVKQEKEALETKLKTLESNYATVNKEFTDFKKRIVGDDKTTPEDPYQELLRRGVKPEEIAGYEAMQEAYFKKKFGVTPDEFTRKYNMTANNASNSNVVAAELNYDRAKARLFDDIQKNSEIRPDYFAKRLEELESEMKPEALAALKTLPSKDLMATLKATYYSEIGLVKADADGIARYKKFLDEAGEASTEAKRDSANVGSFSSNMARKPKESDFEKKGTSLQSAVNNSLFSDE